MSDSNQPTCGKWMPRKKTHCARRSGHKGDCRTAEALADNRERLTDRRRGKRRRDDPAARARWKRAHKFVRLGITEEQFNRLLEAQDYACAMCRQPFGDAYPQIDHDHSCCPPDQTGHARLCGECIRGLLCFRCNTALGYIELYGEMARAYLGSTRECEQGHEEARAG